MDKYNKLRIFSLRSFQTQSSNPKLSCNFRRLVSSFFSFAIFLHCQLNVFHSFFLQFSRLQNQKLSSMVASVFSSVNRGAIDFGYNLNFNRQHNIVHSGLFRLNIYIYIYIYIHSLNWILIFSQLAWLPSPSTRNFSSRFQLCFDFAMHHGSLYCPFMWK